MFKELNNEEMMQVDGGNGLLIGIAAGIIIDAATKSITGKSCSEHLSDAVDSVSKSASSALNSYIKNSKPNYNLIPNDIHTR